MRAHRVVRIGGLFLCGFCLLGGRLRSGRCLPAFAVAFAASLAAFAALTFALDAEAALSLEGSAPAADPTQPETTAVAANVTTGPHEVLAIVDTSQTFLPFS